MYRFILENWVLDRWVRNILTVYPVVIVALIGNIVKHFNSVDPTTNSIFMSEFNFNIKIIHFSFILVDSNTLSPPTWHV